MDPVGGRGPRRERVVSTARRALETAVYGDLLEQPQVGGATTADYLAAVAETRPTLTKAIVEEFTEDIATIARL